jgi:hypothetical protein
MEEEDAVKALFAPLLSKETSLPVLKNILRCLVRLTSIGPVVDQVLSPFDPYPNRSYFFSCLLTIEVGCHLLQPGSSCFKALNSLV